MQERQVTVDIATHALPRPFLVMATQNPIELEGTFPLPEAQLDRFLMKVALGYPDEASENEMLLRFERSDPLDTLESVVGPDEILNMQTEVRTVRVENSVRQYIVNVCRATREHGDIMLGASPRATMALYRTCQARAAINGRDFVIPDDVKQMAPFVLTHRLVVNPQTRLRGRLPEEIVREVVNTVPVPSKAPSISPTHRTMSESFHDLELVAKDTRRESARRARQNLMLAAMSGDDVDMADVAGARGLVLRERENSIFSDAWIPLAILFVIIGISAGRNPGFIALGRYSADHRGHQHSLEKSLSLGRQLPTAFRSHPRVPRRSLSR